MTSEKTIDQIISEILRSGVNDWQALVEMAGLDPAIDFRHANLSGIDFTGANLAGFDFSFANLSGCKFDEAQTKDVQMPTSINSRRYPVGGSVFEIEPLKEIGGKPLEDAASRSGNDDIAWMAQAALPIEFEGMEIELESRAYNSIDGNSRAFVLVNRKAEAADSVPFVRVHHCCVAGDVFHSLRCDCYPQLMASLKKITMSSFGIFIYLVNDDEAGRGLFNKIEAYAHFDQHGTLPERDVPSQTSAYSFVAQILLDLGCERIKLLSNNPSKSEALQREGIHIVEHIPVIAKPNVHNVVYHELKRKRGHRLLKN